jgi:hypothetical protein
MILKVLVMINMFHSIFREILRKILKEFLQLDLLRLLLGIVSSSLKEAVNHKIDSHRQGRMFVLGRLEGRRWSRAGRRI